MTQVSHQVLPWQPTDPFSKDLYEFTNASGVTKRFRIHVRPLGGTMNFEVLNGGFSEGEFSDYQAAAEKYNAL